MARAVVRTLNNSKNTLINGDFNISQRAASFSNGGGGGALLRAIDRWNFWVGGTMASTITRQTPLQPGGFAMRVQRDVGQTTTTNIQITQHVDLATVRNLAGKKMTLSFYVRKGANFTPSLFKVQISTGTAATEVNLVTGGFTGRVDQELNLIPLVTTTQQRFSLTVTIPTNAQQLAINFYTDTYSGTAGAADWYELEKVMLTEGEGISPFTLAGASPAQELALCQRYYARGFQFLAEGTAYATTNCILSFACPVEMRAIPLVGQVPGTSLASAIDETGVAARTPSSLSGSGSGVRGFGIDFAIAGLSVNRSCRLNADIIQADAEL